MTTSSTDVKAVSNGDSTETKPAPREYGVAVLRDAEAKALIGLSSDSLHQTLKVTHEMFGVIYDRDTDPPYAQLQHELEEALTCLQTADHYLRMLGSIIDERSGDDADPRATRPDPWATGPDPWAADSAF